MPTPLQNILAVVPGPACVVRGAHIVYSEGAVVLRVERELWEPRGAMHGNLGKRVKSTKIVVSCTPEGQVVSGQLTSNPGYWPLTPAMIGTNIMAQQTLAIVPAVGNKITMPYSCPTKLPDLILKPTATAWGPIEWTCIGDPQFAPTGAAYFATLASTVADTSFDVTKVISPRYTGAWGASPFDHIETEDGWTISPQVEYHGDYAANYGLFSMRLMSLGIVAKAKPIDMTEANYLTAMKLQDTTALQPGDTVSVSTDDRDLVITGTGLTATLKHMGIGDGGFAYASDALRQGEMTWYNRLTNTGGAIDALWTLA